MNRVWKNFVCVLLVLNLHVWQGGCGADFVPGEDGWVRLNLGADQYLKVVARNSGLADVQAVEVNPQTREFRLLFAGGSRQVTGVYERFGDAMVVTDLTFSHRGLSVHFQIDGLRRVRHLSTSIGHAWSPTTLDLRAPFPAGASELDRYLAMNSELVSQVRNLDAQPLGGINGTNGTGTNGGTSTGGTPAFQTNGKSSAAEQAATDDAVSAILSALGVILVLQAVVAFFPVLYFVFQVIVGVNIVLGLFGSTATGDATQDTTSDSAADDATLRVVNELTGGEPIWYVVLLQYGSGAGTDGNLLGDEAIPAGSSRDFPVPSGVRDFNVITPYGQECFQIYEFRSIDMLPGGTAEIVITGQTTGQVHPPGCG